MLKELVLKNRSYRKFDQNEKIKKEQLLSWIDIARLTPSAANMQQTRYMISCDEKLNDSIFEQLSWAAYLKDWKPSDYQRPTAYIVMLHPIGRNIRHDEGIKAQTILLAACEAGYGGCMLGSFNQQNLCNILAVPEGYEVGLVLAIGKPIEEIVLEDTDSNIKYYRDEKDVHHVPKLKLEDIVFKGRE